MNAISALRAPAVCALWSVSVALAGCVFDPPPISPRALVTCTTGEDCPDDRVCAAGLCARRDAPCLVVQGRDATFQPDGNACGGARICVAGACVAPRCGDGVISAGEQCDDGDANSDSAPNACRTACAQPRCGDGVIDAGEVCDGDASCRADCGKLERCGDGETDMNEECDDANDNPRDGCAACALQGWEATLVVSGRVEGADPLSLSLGIPTRVSVDPLGRVWIMDGVGNRVLRVEADGTALIVAGSGPFGYSGDGGPAVAALLRGPESVAVDAFGRAWIADYGNQVIRRVAVDGTIDTVAGSGVDGFTPDGAPALGAAMRPSAVVLDPQGRVTFIDGRRVRRIEPDGALFTLAGDGSDESTGDGGPARSAGMRPIDLAFDSSGRLLILDDASARVRRVAHDGTISTVAGGGAQGSGADEVPALEAELLAPVAIAVDGDDRVLIVESAFSTLHRMDSDGVMRRIAGTGDFAFDVEVAHALDASFYSLASVAVDAEDRVLVVDSIAQRVCRIDTLGAIEVIAGSVAFRFLNEGANATSAVVQQPIGLALAPDGALLVADFINSRIQRVRTDGVLERVHGTGELVFGANLFPTETDTLAYATGVAVGPDGRIWIADTSYNRVLRLEHDGSVTWVAGTGTYAFGGDGGPALDAAFAGPADLVVREDGAVLIADQGNHRVRRIDPDGTISTVVGSGDSAFSGDGGAAIAAGVDPASIAIDLQGALVIADQANHRVRRVDAAGVIRTIAGTGVRGGAGDGGRAIAAQLSSPAGVAVDALGRILVADQGNDRVRRFGRGGDIETVLGSAAATTCAEGARAVDCALYAPADVLELPGGALAVSDSVNGRVRRVGTDGRVTTLAGALHPFGPAPVARAQLYAPRALLHVGGLGVFAVGGFGRVTLLDVDARRLSVVVGVDDAAEDMRHLARFARLLEEPAGLAWRASTHELFVSERGAHALRVVTLGDDDGLWPAERWLVRTLETDAVGPAGLVMDDDSSALVVVDELAHCVRLMDDSGATRVVLVGTCGVAGNLQGYLSAPSHVARSPRSDALYVADTGNERVLRLSGGVPAVVIGDGTRSSAGEGRPARLFPVDRPGQLALDAHGNLYVGSSTTVRQVANVDGDADADGDDLVRTLYAADRQRSYPQSEAHCLGALTWVGEELHVADRCRGFSIALAPSP